MEKLEFREKIGDDLGADDVAELSLVRGKAGRVEYLQSGVKLRRWCDDTSFPPITDAIWYKTRLASGFSPCSGSYASYYGLKKLMQTASFVSFFPLRCCSCRGKYLICNSMSKSSDHQRLNWELEDFAARGRQVPKSGNTKTIQVLCSDLGVRTSPRVRSALNQVCHLCTRRKPHQWDIVCYVREMVLDGGREGSGVLEINSQTFF